MLSMIFSFHILHTCLHLWRLSRLSSPTISMMSARARSGNRLQSRSTELIIIADWIASRINIWSFIILFVWMLKWLDWGFCSKRKDPNYVDMVRFLSYQAYFSMCSTHIWWHHNTALHSYFYLVNSKEFLNIMFKEKDFSLGPPHFIWYEWHMTHNIMCSLNFGGRHTQPTTV